MTMKNGLYTERELMAEAERTGYKHTGANSHCVSSTGSVMRENFERWYEASIKPLEISYCFRIDGDGYVYAPVADAWEVWQAAIKSQNK